MFYKELGNRTGTTRKETMQLYIVLTGLSNEYGLQSVVLLLYLNVTHVHKKKRGFSIKTNVEGAIAPQGSGPTQRRRPARTLRPLASRGDSGGPRH